MPIPCIPSSNRQKKSATDERLAQFESAAAEYRALKVKPPVSEEQRKLIVQANAMSQQKEYGEALSLYLKAVELDPVSYPAAYFNMALLSAQLQRYKPAITYMKQYLLLEPEAKDARSAQDKIYEWEIMMQKKANENTGIRFITRMHPPCERRESTMSSVRKILGISLCIFMMAVSLGCAAMNPETNPGSRMYSLR